MVMTTKEQAELLAKQAMLEGSRTAGLAEYIGYADRTAQAHRDVTGDYNVPREEMMAKGQLFSFTDFLQNYRVKNNFDRESIRKKGPKMVPVMDAVKFTLHSGLVDALAKIRDKKQVVESRLDNEIAEIDKQLAELAQLDALASLGLEGEW